MLFAAPAHGATATAAASSPIRARLECVAPRVEATDDLIWNVPFSLANYGEHGIYSDSMTCDIEDLDPGITHGPRHSRVAIATIGRLVSALSVGDSTVFQVQVRATCERARLSCRLYVHDGEHNTATFDAGTETDPAPIAVAHPSQFLKGAAGQIEYVSFGAPPESLNAPGILLIHDDGQNARSMLPAASPLLSRGYAVVAVSVPGYGRSGGFPDFAGPRTMESVALALDALEKTPGVSKSRIAVWGMGRGATAAALLAARRPEVRALILQSGGYDLPAVARGTRDRAFATTLATEVGADSAAWRDRSPALAAGRIHSAVLLIHGDLDPRMPAAQARAFAADLKARRVDVESRFVPAVGIVSLYEVRRAALEFLRLHLAP
jgi:pimeloyl-ACP methyl ester carboxylesterase